MTSYSFWQRTLHWSVALCTVLAIPLGLWMTARAHSNLWDALTNALYGSHKLLGVTVLLLMLPRLILKLSLATPPYPPSSSRVFVRAASALHWAVYALLIMVPLLGWAGVTAYPALITLAGYHLPALPFIAKDQALAKQLFALHGTLAWLLAALIALHVGAAFKHRWFNRDGIFERMWPGRNRRNPK